MTVAQLIAKLQAMPQDAPVIVWNVIEIGDGNGEWAAPQGIYQLDGTERGIDHWSKPKMRCVVIE